MKRQGENNIVEIDKLLASFSELYNNCKENNGTISLLEIDLMKGMLRDLYQQVNELGNLQNNLSAEHTSIGKLSEAVQKNQINTETKIKSSYAEEIQSPENIHYPEANTSIPSDNSIRFAELIIESDAATPVQNNKETINNLPKENIIPAVNKTVYKIEEPIIEQIQPEIQVAQFQPKSDKKINLSPVTLFDEPVASVKDKFKETESVYNQIAKSHKDDSLVGQLQKKPVSDLRKSIGINERFAFINELFNGNQQLFSENIDKINGCTNYQEADKMYLELGKTMNWNTESKTFGELSELIKRRFNV